MGRASQTLMGVVITIASWLAAVGVAEDEPQTAELLRPQLLAGPRLLKLGEGVEFRCFVPDGTEAGDLAIFPRYLEQSGARAESFKDDGQLDWLDSLPRETVPLEFSEGRAAVTYTPREPGNYLARWTVGGENLYRYFAVVTDKYVVVRYTTGGDWRPNFHSTGIAIEYRLESSRFSAEDPEFAVVSDYQRRFGDGVVPLLADTPDLTQQDRRTKWSGDLARARARLTDPDDARAVQVAQLHPLEPGYAKALMMLGVSDQGGMWESNGGPWLGMPEFPYFASPLDERKPNQQPGGELVAHQWDFCGGWHFLGPPPWHYQVAEGNFEVTDKCLRQALKEGENLAAMSGHPAVLMPLFGGAQSEPIIYPPSHFAGQAWNLPGMNEYLDRYIAHLAFVYPCEYKLVFARSLDVADYYRTHYAATPRTVFVSRTDHLDYDRWWLAGYAGDRVLVTSERIPWDTRVQTLETFRNLLKHVYKDPRSTEFLLVEDQRRQIRFERECPTPVWWFDYTRQESELAPGGSHLKFTPTPEVRVERTRWQRTEGELTVTLRMDTQASQPDYAVVLWGLPEEFSRDPDPARLETNAKELILAWNTVGEHHLVLGFDLAPGRELTVTIKEPK